MTSFLNYYSHLDLGLPCGLFPFSLMFKTFCGMYFVFKLCLYHLIVLVIDLYCKVFIFKISLFLSSLIPSLLTNKNGGIAIRQTVFFIYQFTICFCPDSVHEVSLEEIHKW
jgi:hypothetical protein